MKKSIKTGILNIVLSGLFITLTAAANPAQGAVPELINFQGKLTNSAGTPVTTLVPMEFRLYAAADDVLAVWTENQNVTPDAYGIYSVLLGSAAPFSAVSINFSAPYWLGVTVGADSEMLPRYRLVSSVYSLYSLNSATAAYAVGSGTSAWATGAPWAGITNKPALGTGDVVLAAAQTFTGINTFAVNPVFMNDNAIPQVKVNGLTAALAAKAVAATVAADTTTITGNLTSEITTRGGADTTLSGRLGTVAVDTTTLKGSINVVAVDTGTLYGKFTQVAVDTTTLNSKYDSGNFVAGTNYIVSTAAIVSALSSKYDSGNFIAGTNYQAPLVAGTDYIVSTAAIVTALSSKYDAVNFVAGTDYIVSAAGDNLGDHMATGNLNMSNYNITNGTQPGGSNFLGDSAGADATDASNSNFLGDSAGAGATVASNSNFIGASAGANATDAADSNFLGSGAGNAAASAFNSNFLGNSAGNAATSANNSNFLGTGAGDGATYAENSSFLGAGAGARAVNAANSIFMGTSAGTDAVEGAANSIFIGSYAGSDDLVNNVTTFGTSIAIGRYAGTGGFSDSIAIGHGVINSATKQLNIGNVIYASNIHNSDELSAAPQLAGKVGIGTDAPDATLTVKGSVDFSAGSATVGSTLRLGYSETQIIDAAGTITADATYKRITTDGTTRTTSTTQAITDGVTGQIMIIHNDSAFTINITNGANTRLGGADVSLVQDGILMVIFNGTDWIRLAMYSTN